MTAAKDGEGAEQAQSEMKRAGRAAKRQKNKKWQTYKGHGQRRKNLNIFFILILRDF